MNGKVLAVGVSQGPLNVFSHIAAELDLEAVLCHSPREALIALGKGKGTFSVAVIDGTSAPNFKPILFADAITRQNSGLRIVYVGDRDDVLCRKVERHGWTFMPRNEVTARLAKSLAEATS
jgi:hypothetical protein